MFYFCNLSVSLKLFQKKCLCVEDVAALEPGPEIPGQQAGPSFRPLGCAKDFGLSSKSQ